MAKIKVTSKCHFYDGMSITFKAPCNFSAIDGLKVKDPATEKTFIFKDALGNTLTGIDHIFSKNAYVKVVLDTTNHFAYVQNGETPGYGVIKDETKPLFGLAKTAAPDDVFKKIGLGGMNYIPTTVEDKQIFEEWNLYKHLPIDPEKAAVRDFQYLEDAYYLLTQHTAASPYSFILWRSEDLVNWTQGATISQITNQYYVQNAWENRIFRVNGRFLAVINERSYYDGSGYTRVFYSNTYNGTFSTAAVSGKTRCKSPRMANGLLFMHSETTTTPSWYVYDVSTNKYSSGSYNGYTEAKASDVCYFNGKYYVTEYGQGNSYSGKTCVATITNSSSSISISVDGATNYLSAGGGFLQHNGNLYVYGIQGTSVMAKSIYKIDTSNLSASPLIYSPTNNTDIYFSQERNGQLWLALSRDPSVGNSGSGFYIPANDFKSFTKVLDCDNTTLSSFSRNKANNPWTINEDKRIISFDMQVTETTYKVIPKIIDYFGNNILIPGDQITGGVQVISGSYVGTGTYGKNNPNTLTFDFEPKLIIISSEGYYHRAVLPYMGHGIMTSGSSFDNYTIAFYGLAVTWSGKTVSWYNTGSADYQCNNSSYIYHYVAIG